MGALTGLSWVYLSSRGLLIILAASGSCKARNNECWCCCCRLYDVCAGNIERYGPRLARVAVCLGHVQYSQDRGSSVLKFDTSTSLRL